MFENVLCISHQHNPWLVLMAAAVSLTASSTTLWMVLTGAARGQREGDPWRLYAGLVGGSGIWATHFICMLAFDPGLPIGYDAGGAAISLLIALSFTCAAVFVADRLKGSLRLPAWALLFVTGVGAMHYYGTLALRTAGVMSWDPAYLCGSLIAGLALSALALGLLGERFQPRRFLFASLALTLSVCALHFIGMAGLRIAPDPRILVPVGTAPRAIIAFWVGGLTLLILLAGVCAVWLATRARSSALELLKGAFEAAPQGLAYFDANDRLMFGNEAYHRGEAALGVRCDIGLTYAEMLRRAAASGAAPAAVGHEAEWMADLLQARQQASTVREQETPDGRVFQVFNNHTADGGIVTSSMDITDLKQQALELTAARDAARAADRAKSIFLANMSHELRTPMNGVIGVAALLAQEPLTERQAELVAIIQASGSTLDRLLADLMDMSRLDAGEMDIQRAPLHLGEAVREVCALVAAQADEKALRLRVEVACEANAWFVGDLARIKQILTSLVSNAIKFTERGEVVVTASAVGGRVMVSVADTGIGFDPADTARLFARFEQADGSVTRRYGGSGLGLAVAHHLAERMDGGITAQNRDGGGSVFTLSLPLATAPQPSSQPEWSPSGQARVRALVVDDNTINQRVLSLILEGLGLDCALADNGVEAVERWRAEAFDLVFMDIQMPVMDGITAVRTIRALEAEGQLARTPIIMVSANCQSSDIKASRAAGADAHLGKPVLPERLMEAIEQALGGSDGRQAAAA